MHEECKGCRDENTLCAKKYIEPVCPCTTCLVKPMCTTSCEVLRAFVAENLEELKYIHSKWLKKDMNIKKDIHYG
jgi:hypothetical protein